MKTTLFKIGWDGEDLVPAAWVPWTHKPTETPEEVEAVAVSKAIRTRGGAAALPKGRATRLEVWRHAETDPKHDGGQPLVFNSTIYSLTPAP